MDGRLMDNVNKCCSLLDCQPAEIPDRLRQLIHDIEDDRAKLQRIREGMSPIIYVSDAGTIVQRFW